MSAVIHQRHRYTQESRWIITNRSWDPLAVYKTDEEGHRIYMSIDTIKDPDNYTPVTLTERCAFTIASTTPPEVWKETAPAHLIPLIETYEYETISFHKYTSTV